MSYSAQKHFLLPHLYDVLPMHGQRQHLTSVILLCTKHKPKNSGMKALNMGLNVCLQKDFVKIPGNEMESIYSVYSQFAIYKMKVIGW